MSYDAGTHIISRSSQDCVLASALQHSYLLAELDKRFLVRIKPSAHLGQLVSMGW